MIEYWPGRATVGAEPRWSGYIATSPTITTTRWTEDWTSVAPVVTTGAAVTSGTRLLPAADGTLVTPDHLCPDMLRWSNIGPADGARGRVVRAFFQLMRLWPAKG